MTQSEILNKILSELVPNNKIANAIRNKLANANINEFEKYHWNLSDIDVGENIGVFYNNKYYPNAIEIDWDSMKLTSSKKPQNIPQKIWDLKILKIKAIIESKNA